MYLLDLCVYILLLFPYCVLSICNLPACPITWAIPLGAKVMEDKLSCLRVLYLLVPTLTPLVPVEFSVLALLGLVFSM